MVPIPSLFFIGENGTPLEIVAGITTVDDLVSKIDSVLTKAGKSNKHSSSANLINIEQKAAAINSSNNNDTVEAATSNINNVKHDLNTNLISSESTTADISTSKNEVIEDPIKATEPSLSTEIKDNNEPPKENAEAQQNHEIKRETQNKELTAEVCQIYKHGCNIVVARKVNYIFPYKYLGEGRESTAINRGSTKTTIGGGTEKGTGT